MLRFPIYLNKELFLLHCFSFFFFLFNLDTYSFLIVVALTFDLTVPQFTELPGSAEEKVKRDRERENDGVMEEDGRRVFTRKMVGAAKTKKKMEGRVRKDGWRRKTDVPLGCEEGGAVL